MKKKQTKKKFSDKQKQKKRKYRKQNSSQKKQLLAMLDEIYEPEQLPETITDEYKVLSTLSYSASKSVFLLEGKDDKKRCICKCRQSDKGMLLEAEYQYLMRLTENPEGQNLSCFPKVYAYFQEEGREYLIREYMDGVTLSSYLEEHGPCSVKEAIDILIPVCATIKVLHQQNPPLIHRDIKPDNILISEKNGKKSFHMIDLDTVREYKITSQRDTVFIGTVETAAPEQFGYQQTSIRTDIYSLGVLLVFLLTGQFSVHNDRWLQLPKEMRRIVSRCLAIDPQDRYSSVEKLIRELRCMRRFACRRKVLYRFSIAVTAAVCIAAAISIYMIRDYRYHKKSVQFANESIREAAMQALGKKDKEIIYPYELEQVTTLILCSDRIFTSWQEHQDFHDNEWFVFNEEDRAEEPADLSDLKYFPNLHTLVLDNQGISDLHMLKGLPLEKLSLQKNELVSLSGISDCNTLSCLHLTDNPLEDVTPLAGISSLRELKLSQTAVSDISPFQDIPLRNLDVSNTLVTDFSVLPSSNNLQYLLVSGMGEEDIEKLGQMQQLVQLGVFESDIESLSQLSGLKYLESLDFTNCQKVKSLDGIEEFPSLTYLGIAGTGITDISALKNAAMLQMLDLTNAPVTDFSVLKDIPQLNTIWIDSGKEGLINQEDIPDVTIWVQ